MSTVAPGIAPTLAGTVTEELHRVGERLVAIESALAELRDLVTRQQGAKSWYATEEIARILGKAEFTVREWCRLGRVQGAKQGSGRGKYQAWVVSHAELLRIQRDGLLPRKRPA
jgi:hypothetical protein